MCHLKDNRAQNRSQNIEKSMWLEDKTIRFSSDEDFNEPRCWQIFRGRSAHNHPRDEFHFQIHLDVVLVSQFRATFSFSRRYSEAQADPKRLND